MDNNEQPAVEANAGITQATFDAGVAAARADGTTKERERSKAVRSSEHFAGREGAAYHMLDTTDMTAEAIVGVLAGLSTGQPAVAGERASTSSIGIAIGGDAGKTSPKSNNHGWDDVVAEVNQSIKH